MPIPLSARYDRGELDLLFGGTQLGYIFGQPAARAFLEGPYHDELTDVIETGFEYESQPSMANKYGLGRGWAQLTEYTKMERIMSGFEEGPINQRSGKMRETLLESGPHVSLTSTGVELAAWDEGAGDDDMRRKMKTAQTGGVRVPARRVLPEANKGHDARITELAEDFYERSIREILGW